MRCERSCSRTGRSATSCWRRSSPGARRCSGCRASAWRSSARTRPRRRCGCSTSRAATAPVHLARTRRAARVDGEPAAGAAAGRRRAARPVDRAGSRALGIGRELAPREEVDLLVVGGRPGRPRRRRLRRLRGARHARHREHRARRTGGLVATDRELPRLPRGHQRHRADQPRGHPGAQVRRPHGDAIPRGLARTRERTPPRPAGGGPRDRRARGPARDRRAIPAAAGRAARPSTRG